MKHLHLNLTTQWYNRHLEDKQENYRELTPYWASRLCANYTVSQCYTSATLARCMACNNFDAKLYEGVILRKGYTSESTTKDHLDTIIGVGNPEWGAPTKKVFIIKCK